PFQLGLRDPWACSNLGAWPTCTGNMPLQALLIDNIRSISSPKSIVAWGQHDQLSGDYWGIYASRAKLYEEPAPSLIKSCCYRNTWRPCEFPIEWHPRGDEFKTAIEHVPSLAKLFSRQEL